MRALCILGPEEILKLAHGLHREEISFKKAAGEDLVFWKERSSETGKKPDRPKTEAKILHFGRPTPQVDEKPQSTSEETGDDPQIMSSEVILMQREIARETASGSQKQTAKSGYQKSNEMYVVKSSTLDGKEKIRFASTNGVLVNKKQA